MKPVLAALAATLFAILACSLTVRVNYGGNWTGLFCTGERMPEPPELAARAFTFKNSGGFDGQFYRIIAHDPWFQRGYTLYIDAPAMRYRRILMPALAWLLAMGQDPLIDFAYIGLAWTSLFLGALWLALFANDAGRTAWWGAAYLLIPATGISIDRMLTDLPMITLGLGFLWYARRNNDAAAWPLAAAACLARETGILFLAAYCLWLCVERHYARAARLATAALPLLAWSGFVALHTQGPGVPGKQGLPFVAILQAFPDPIPYPLTGLPLLAVQGFDAAALIAMLVAWALVWTLRKRSPDLFAIGVAFVALGLFMGARTGSTDFIGVYNYGRYYSPILLLLLIDSFRNGRWWRNIPTAIDALRVALSLAPQVYMIVRGR